ncbi:MAG TPA: AMP-binding protein [Myxococcota bacterium]|nr:AMP-binding protein [Myxococcota bacterium]
MSWTGDHQGLALSDQRRSWTYSQLRDEAARWAGTLAARGVEAGDRVALLARNRGEFIVLLLSCEHLGAIFQPMNWRLSEAELDWQIADSTPRVVLRDADLDEGPGDAAIRGDERAETEPWMLLYTSGTTGKPKGALITHGQVRANAAVTLGACELTAEDSTLTFTPLFHTGGLNCLTTPLLRVGGHVVLRPSLEDALDVIRDEGITLLTGVPTIYQFLSERPGFSEAMGSVRDALCGGAPLSLTLLQTYLELGIPLRQGFGLTEVGPNCFSTPPQRVREKLGTVGRLVPGLEARLVDGELQLRGPMVFGGYWGHPPHEGWFHTGDVLQVDDEGFWSVTGRKKEMFISGGENVYPAEVEAALYACGGIAQCAVIGVEDERWGEVGRAFVEPSPGATLSPEALHGALQGRLARYKQPKRIEVLASLPRTPSGKIDKQRLGEMP